jgi:hypothetical protein
MGGHPPGSAAAAGARRNSLIDRAMVLRASQNNSLKNDSKYARRRSVWKGTCNQLRDVVDSLKKDRAYTVYEYHATGVEICQVVSREFGIVLGVNRLTPQGFSPIGSWAVKLPPSQKFLNLFSPVMRPDVHTIWLDFNTVFGRRFNQANGAGFNPKKGEYWLANENSLLVIASAPRAFDIIVAKGGYTLRSHFYHWQARVGNLAGTVNCDWENDSPGHSFIRDDGGTGWVLNL